MLQHDVNNFINSIAGPDGEALERFRQKMKRREPNYIQRLAEAAVRNGMDPFDGLEQDLAEPGGPEEAVAAFMDGGFAFAPVPGAGMAGEADFQVADDSPDGGAGAHGNPVGGGIRQASARPDRSDRDKRQKRRDKRVCPPEPEHVPGLCGLDKRAADLIRRTLPHSPSLRQAEREAKGKRVMVKVEFKRGRGRNTTFGWGNEAKEGQILRVTIHDKGNPFVARCRRTGKKIMYFNSPEEALAHEAGQVLDRVRGTRGSHKGNDCTPSVEVTSVNAGNEYRRRAGIPVKRECYDDLGFSSTVSFDRHTVARECR